MVALKAAGIEPYVHVIHACAGARKLQPLEEIVCVDICRRTKVNLIRPLIRRISRTAEAGYHHLQFLRYGTADIHTAKVVLCPLDIRCVPCEVRGLQIHCSQHNRIDDGRNLVGRRSLDGYLQSVVACREDIAYVYAEVASAHHQAVCLYQFVRPRGSLVDMCRHIEILFLRLPLGVRYTLLLRFETKLHIGGIVRRSEIHGVCSGSVGHHNSVLHSVDGNRARVNHKVRVTAGNIFVTFLRIAEAEQCHRRRLEITRPYLRVESALYETLHRRAAVGQSVALVFAPVLVNALYFITAYLRHISLILPSFCIIPFPRVVPIACPEAAADGIPYHTPAVGYHLHGA